MLPPGTLRRPPPRPACCFRLLRAPLAYAARRTGPACDRHISPSGPISSPSDDDDDGDDGDDDDDDGGGGGGDDDGDDDAMVLRMIRMTTLLRIPT